MSPKEWLIHQRLERAKSQLESTNQNIDDIACNSGFETAMAMRHNFRKYLQLSATDHRKQFSGCDIVRQKLSVHLLPTNFATQ